jgi:hypothetical protein
MDALRSCACYSRVDAVGESCRKCRSPACGGCFDWPGQLLCAGNKRVQLEVSVSCMWWLLGGCKVCMPCRKDMEALRSCTCYSRVDVVGGLPEVAVSGMWWLF